MIEFDMVKFTDDIDDLCDGGYTLIEAIVEWCEANGVELESVIPFIRRDAVLKARLAVNADSLNLLKKEKK